MSSLADHNPTRAFALAVCTLALLFQPATVAAQNDSDTLLVTTEWLNQRLDEPGLVILHVARAAGEYDAGHIPGARFVDHNSIAAEMDGRIYELRPVEQLVSAMEEVGVSDDDRIVIYGHPIMAGRMFFTLEYLGHRGRVSVLDARLAAWRAAELPVSTEHETFTRSTFTPHINSDVVVDAGWALDHLEQPEFAFVDARPNDQYGDGHLPGAGNLFYTDVLTDSIMGALKNPTELRNLFRQAGVADGDGVVTYCAIGMRASFLYFVARYLGYDVSMYDGSFSEWGGLEGMPVERGR